MQKSLNAPWGSILKSMPVHALSVAHFVCMWGIYTNLSCLPQYYIQILAFDVNNVSYFCVIINTKINNFVFILFIYSVIIVLLLMTFCVRVLRWQHFLTNC